MEAPLKGLLPDPPKVRRVNKRTQLRGEHAPLLVRKAPVTLLLRPVGESDAALLEMAAAEPPVEPSGREVERARLPVAESALQRVEAW
jgi:hypothetical protein